MVVTVKVYHKFYVIAIYLETKEIKPITLFYG